MRVEVEPITGDLTDEEIEEIRELVEKHIEDVKELLGRECGEVVLKTESEPLPGSNTYHLEHVVVARKGTLYFVQREYDDLEPNRVLWCYLARLEVEE